MGFFIFTIFLLLLALIALGAAIFGPKTYEADSGSYRGGSVTKPTHIGLIGSVVSAVLVVVAALVFVPSGINDVASRTVAVPITFGKAGAPLTPGFHWEMPWTTVASMSTKVQTDNYNQDDKIANWTGTCITVRLADGQEGCADISISYHINDSGATQLYLDYGSGNDIMSQVQSSLVYRGIRDGLNNTLQNYNPILDALQSATSGSSQFSQFDPSVISYLNKTIGQYVSIGSFDLNYVHYSDSVQQQLDGIQAKQGQLQQEKEQLLINTATAQANRALVSQSGTLTPDELAQECYTIVQNAEKDNYTLPATWNCSGAATSGVIVNAGTTSK